ncbi:MAG TPA: hypothetical protein VFQ86_01895 [Arachidicoccus soli]|nr:hypothetical protein [Arachidicoccus soli]
MKQTFILSALFMFSVNMSFAQSGLTPDKSVLMQYFENQEYAQAANYLQPIIQADSGNIHNLSLLGYTYYMSNQLASAEECYLKIWNQDSSNIVACNYLGKINLKKQNNPLALHYFCRLIDLKPGVAAYYKEAAFTWNQMSNFPAAGYYYQLSYFINPNDPQVTASLADYWLGQKIYNRADSILDAALQKDSLDAGLIEEKIKSAYQQNKYPVIFPLIERLKRMNTIDLNSYLYGAIGYFYLKQYQPCVDLCDYLIVHHYQTRPVLFTEAIAFKEQKRYSESLATLDECIGMALDKQATEYFDAKASIYTILKQYDKAFHQYDTAYYIFHNPSQIYSKALLYDIQLKKPLMALKYYRRYLHRIDGKPTPLEAPIWDYVNARVKQLEEWEKKRK